MFEQQPLRNAIGKHVGGGTPSRQVPSYWNGPIPWASVKDFSDGGDSLLSTQECITEAGLRASASNLIPAGTPLVCTRMAIGRSAMAPMPLAINQDVKALTPAGGTSAVYLLRLLQYLKPHADAAAVGSTVKGIRIQDYLSIAVPMAPEGDQAVICAILDTLDTTIRQTEAIIEKIKQVKQGLLYDLLTRGIDANGELRPPQCNSPHLYKKTLLGWLPCSWQTIKFGEIGRAPQLGLVVRGTSTDGEDVGLLKMGNLLVGNQLDLARVEALDVRQIDRVDDYVLADGDLLFNTRNTPELVGKTCSWLHRPGITVFDNNILRMRVAPSVGSGHFLASYMGGATGRSRLLGLATGTTSVAAIYWKDLQHFEVPLPSPEEQDEIVMRLDACDVLVQHEQSAAKNHEALKSGLMDDLLTGRVRVTALLAAATP